MSQNRVAPGVPTGGQFAASAHAESGVTLGPRTGSPYQPRAETTAALAAIEKMMATAQRLDDIRTLVHVRDKAREQFGDGARFIHAVEDDGSDDGSGVGSMSFVAYDEDGEVVDEYFAEGFEPLSGQALPADWYGSTGEWFDLKVLDKVDLAAEVKKAEMTLAHDAINRHAAKSLVIDAMTIGQQVDAETEDGAFASYLRGEERVTAAEHDLIAAEFDAQRVGLISAYDDFDAEARRATEAVLARTRG